MTNFETYFSLELNELLIIRDDDYFQSLDYENNKVQMLLSNKISHLSLQDDYIEFNEETIVFEDSFYDIRHIYYKILEEYFESSSFVSYLNQVNKCEQLTQMVQNFISNNPEIFI